MRRRRAVGQVSRVGRVGQACRQVNWVAQACRQVGRVRRGRRSGQEGGGESQDPRARGGDGGCSWWKAWPAAGENNGENLGGDIGNKYENDVGFGR